MGKETQKKINRSCFSNHHKWRWVPRFFPMQGLMIPNPVRIWKLRYLPEVYVMAKEFEYCQEMLESLNGSRYNRLFTQGGKLNLNTNHMGTSSLLLCYSRTEIQGWERTSIVSLQQQSLPPVFASVNVVAFWRAENFKQALPVPRKGCLWDMPSWHPASFNSLSAPAALPPVSVLPLFSLPHPSAWQLLPLESAPVQGQVGLCSYK